MLSLFSYSHNHHHQQSAATDKGRQNQQHKNRRTFLPQQQKHHPSTFEEEYPTPRNSRPPPPSAHLRRQRYEEDGTLADSTVYTSESTHKADNNNNNTPSAACRPPSSRLDSSPDFKPARPSHSPKDQQKLKQQQQEEERLQRLQRLQEQERIQLETDDIEEQLGAYRAALQSSSSSSSPSHNSAVYSPRNYNNNNNSSMMKRLDRKIRSAPIESSMTATEKMQLHLQQQQQRNNNPATSPKINTTLVVDLDEEEDDYDNDGVAPLPQYLTSQTRSSSQSQSSPTSQSTGQQHQQQLPSTPVSVKSSSSSPASSKQSLSPSFYFQQSSSPYSPRHSFPTDEVGSSPELGVGDDNNLVISSPLSAYHEHQSPASTPSKNDNNYHRSSDESIEVVESRIQQKALILGERDRHHQDNSCNNSADEEDVVEQLKKERTAKGGEALPFKQLFRLHENNSNSKNKNNSANDDDDAVSLASLSLDLTMSNVSSNLSNFLNQNDLDLMTKEDSPGALRLTTDGLKQHELRSFQEPLSSIPSVLVQNNPLGSFKCQKEKERWLRKKREAEEQQKQLEKEQHQREKEERLRAKLQVCQEGDEEEEEENDRNNNYEDTPIVSPFRQHQHQKMGHPDLQVSIGGSSKSTKVTSNQKRKNGSSLFSMFRRKDKGATKLPLNEQRSNIAIQPPPPALSSGSGSPFNLFRKNGSGGFASPKVRGCRGSSGVISDRAQQYMLEEERKEALEKKREQDEAERAKKQRHQRRQEELERKEKAIIEAKRRKWLDEQRAREAAAASQPKLLEDIPLLEPQHSSDVSTIYPHDSHTKSGATITTNGTGTTSGYTTGGSQSGLLRHRRVVGGDEEGCFFISDVSAVSSKSGASLPPCVVCGMGIRTHIATPCMHFSFCGPCATNLQQQQCSSPVAPVVCPVCKEPNVQFFGVSV